MRKRTLAALLLAVCLCLSLLGCRDRAPAPTPAPAPTETVTAAPTAMPSPSPTADPKGNTESLDEDGSYDSKEEVARYLQTYGQLPGNYMTKDEAQALGWQGGDLERYAPGMCIGGDKFSNREGLLPRAKGRTWRECDIDTLGESNRGAKRIVYSNDGLIYYTDDHYESFEQISPGNP